MRGFAFRDEVLRFKGWRGCIMIIYNYSFSPVPAKFHSNKWFVFPERKFDKKLPDSISESQRFKICLGHTPDPYTLHKYRRPSNNCIYMYKWAEGEHARIPTHKMDSLV